MLSCSPEAGGVETGLEAGLETGWQVLAVVDDTAFSEYKTGPGGDTGVVQLAA
jgi:hypothetical protein